MERGGCVYILTNKVHTVLYTGVTSDLELRLWQHRTKFFKDSFSARYNCHILVYYQFFPDIGEAIDEEHRIKSGNRAHKEKLINSINPNWEEITDFY